MGDVAFPPSDPETDPDTIQHLIERVDAAYRVSLTGREGGHIRRKSLFLVAAMGAVTGIAVDGVVGMVLGTLGLIALLLLAMTDDVIA